MVSAGLSLTNAPEIVFVSAAMQRAVELVKRFAATKLPILLVGQTGTGKELFAEAIHRYSLRTGRFVDINCGALPRELIEGELFGHARGAYTGALTDHPGLLAAAVHGTVFLDEIGSLALESQTKLLRVMESGRARRLGESTDRAVEFRIVSAAHEGIEADVARGSLRLDLYERLAGVVIPLPPLKDRQADVIPLARHFAALAESRLTREAEAALLSYSWPGNVRELRLTIERAVILSEGAKIDETTMNEAMSLGISRALDREVRRIASGAKIHALQALCAEHAWQARAIATALGISRATLFRRLRACGLSLRRKAPRVEVGPLPEGETVDKTS